MFPDGFPALEELSVPRVPLKSLELDKLRETHRKLVSGSYLSPEADDWWTTTLNNVEKEDAEACTTCSEIRRGHMENCRSKHDAPEVAREKDRHQRQASQRLIQHLHEHSHEEYPKDILFPPAVYTWNKENNSYDDNIEEKIELKESEQQLVEALGALREDTTETHFVGVTGLSKRSAGSKNARPEKLEVGHVVVVRTEDDDPHSSYLPFFVGEVLGVEDAEGNADSKVHICEYSSPTLVRTHRSDQPEEVALIEVHKVRWQANFRGADSGRQERDEFHRDASCKPSTNAFKPP